jgi:hypothetical protein
LPLRLNETSLWIRSSKGGLGIPIKNPGGK